MDITKDINISNKPFSVLGRHKLDADGRHFSIIPICLMCNKTLNEPYYTSTWVNPDFERNYIYFLCVECFEKYAQDETREIENKLMFLRATLPRMEVR